MSRKTTHGPDESGIHGPEEARVFREKIAKHGPGARITWAFSCLALHDERENYRKLRKQVVEYHREFGDGITFIRGPTSRTRTTRASR